jgi:hypothetical protein
MSSFLLASQRLTRSGQGETAYKYFKMFLETVANFPSIGMCLTTYYTAHPVIVNQSVATSFPYLETMKDDLFKYDPGTPFSGSAQHQGNRQQRRANNKPKNKGNKTNQRIPRWSSHPGTRHHHGLCTIRRRNPAPTGYADGTGTKLVPRRTVRYAGSLPARHRVLRLSTP